MSFPQPYGFPHLQWKLVQSPGGCKEEDLQGPTPEQHNKVASLGSQLVSASPCAWESSRDWATTRHVGMHVLNSLMVALSNV